MEAVDETEPENDEAVEAVDVVPVDTPNEKGFGASDSALGAVEVAEDVPAGIPKENGFVTGSVLVAVDDGINGVADTERPKLGLVGAGPKVNGFEGDDDGPDEKGAKTGLDFC